jgi:hypothetical protein
MDGVRGILTYSFSKVTLNPRTNADFTNIQNTSCGTIGTEEAEIAQGVICYPNPTTGRITVAFPTAPRGTYAASVLDVTGRIVAQQNLSFAGAEADLDLSQLQNGNYLLSIQGKDGSRHTQRVVVVR